MIDLQKELQNNEYPGRGIIVGLSEDGQNAVTAYFIMGRSENSRNRIFAPIEGGIETKAFDESKLSDPSLIIYNPVRTIGNKVIVTNGDQTDTVYDFIKEGKTFEDALRTREFEPDAPNFTPRISGMLTTIDGKLSYELSILKSTAGNSESCERFFYDYQTPIAGQGRFIHTYRCDGNPIPSFEGEPKHVAIGNDMDAFANMLWSSLNADNKVSLFVQYLPLNGGQSSTKIINKNQ